jgi:hypothetical protein
LAALPYEKRGVNAKRHSSRVLGRCSAKQAWHLICIGSLISCSTGIGLPDGYSLLAPEGLDSEARLKTIEECRDAARLQAWNKPPLTNDDKAPLEGRSTVKFFYRGLPVVIGKDMVPMIYKTWIDPPGGYTSLEVSDRYVLCLMKRGYTWPHPDE